jgi:hypothetical protein
MHIYFISFMCITISRYIICGSYEVDNITYNNFRYILFETYRRKINSFYSLNIPTQLRIFGIELKLSI